MKKTLFIILTLTFLFAVESSAHMMGGMMGGGIMGGMMGMPGYEEGYGYPEMMGPCMMMGPGMMGQGMMGGMMGHGMMGRGMMGPCMWGYGAKEYQKFMDDTRELRKELHNKRFEYFEAMRDPDTKPETVNKLEKEMWEIQRKIYEKSQK